MVKYFFATFPIISGVFLFLSISHIIMSASTDPCLKHTNTQTNTKARHIKNILSSGSRGLCDNRMSAGWYRFTTSDGKNQIIPTKPPPLNGCGTVYPIWFNGDHPKTINRVSTGKACIRAGKDDCFDDSLPIKVVKCHQNNEEFFVYSLKHTSVSCPSSYCLDNAPTPTVVVITTAAPVTTIRPTIGLVVAQKFPIEISDGIVNQKIINGSSYITKTGAFFVQLTTDKGTIRIPKGPEKTLPSACSKVSDASTGLFCVDSKSGDIYATSGVNLLYLGSQNFTLTVMIQVVDFPGEPVTIEVQFTDECSSTSKPYNELLQSECSSFRSAITSGFTVDADLNIIFKYNRKSIAQQIASLTIKRNVFGSQVGEEVLIIRDRLAIGADKVIKFKVLNITGDVHVPVSIPEDGVLSREFIFILNGLRLFVDSISVNEIRSWDPCKRDECVATYKEWKRNILGTSQSKCKKDPDDIETFFGQCTNLKPEFITTPIYADNTISNCIYSSLYSFDLKYAYLLINGVVKRNFKLIDEALIPKSLPSYRVSSYYDVGNVQCAIFDPDRMNAPVLSNFTKVSFAPPTFRSTKPWFAIDTAIIGNPLTLNGCILSSRFTLTKKEAFWLRDGEIVSNVSAAPGRFPQLQLKELTLLNTGFYQCGVKVAPVKDIIKSGGLALNAEAVNIEFTNQPKLEIYRQQIRLQGCRYKFNAAQLGRSDSGSFKDAFYFEVSNSSGIFRLSGLPQPTPTPSTPPVTTTEEILARKRRAAEEIFAEIPAVVLTNVFNRGAKYRCVVFDTRYMHDPVNSSWVEGNSLSLKVTIDSKPVNRNGVVQGCTYTSTEDMTSFSYLLLNDTTRINHTTKGTAGKSTLNFTLTSYRFKGYFQCVIFNTNWMRKPVVSNYSDFISLQEPTFLRASPDAIPVIKTAGEDSTFTLPGGCEMTVIKNLEFGPKEVYWLKDGVEKNFLNLSQFEIIPTKDGSGNIYRFENKERTVAFDAEGVYQCVADFDGLDAPVIKRTFNVTIKDFPVSFRADPSVGKIMYKDEYQFSGCEIITKNFNLINKHTVLEFRPSLNGTTRRSNATFRAIRPDERRDFYTTTVFKIDSFDQFGRYKCIVFNPSVMRRPVDSRESILPVVNYPRFTSSPKGSSNATYLAWGSRFTITGCRLNSTLLKGFKYQWLKDGKLYQTPRSLTTLKGSGERQFPDLRLFSLRPSLNGTYRCALHLPGLPLQLSAPVSVNLKVIEAEFVTNPVWQINEDSIQVAGCKYNATQALFQYAYYLLNENQKLQISESEFMFSKDKDGYYHLPPLTIRSFDQLGKYECVIENQLIRDQKIVSAAVDLTSLKGSDVLPTFKKHPTSKHSNTTGGRLLISGCVFHTKIPLSRSEKVFYLFNSITPINIIFPILNIRTGADGGLDRITGEERTGSEPVRPFLPPREEGDFFRFNPEIKMAAYIKDRNSYEDQGFYQCGVTIGSGPFQKTILSNSVDVQFIDVASAKMNVRLDQQWNENLKNSSSENFKKLEKQFLDDILKFLPEENGVKPLVRILGFKSGSVIADTQVIYPNVSETSRREKCKQFQKLLEDGVKQSLTFKVTNVDVKSLDCCSEDEDGETSFKGVEKFPETLVSRTVTNNCTYKQSASQKSQRQCLGNMKDGPKWSDVNLQNCPAKSPTTNSLIELSGVKICGQSSVGDCQTPIEISGNLSQLINQTDSITTRQDLEYISIVLKNLATHPTAFLPNDTDNAEKIVSNVLETVSNVIGSNRTIVAQAQTAKQTSSTILQSLSTLAKRLGKIAASLSLNETIRFVFENPNVALAVVYSEPKLLKVVGGFDLENNMSLDIKAREGDDRTNSNQSLTILASARIPKETFRNKSQVVYSFLFRDDTLFQTKNQTNALQSGQPITSPLSSKILDVTVGKEKLVNLSIPILFNFKKVHHQRIVNEDVDVYNNTCTFWNAQKVGFWSSSGCWRVNETETHILCECNHLTNFAILLDVSGKQDNPLELRIITWIGCGISLAGLFLTLLTYTMFGKLHKKLPPKILMSLALSLFVLLIVFLVGAERDTVGSKVGCQIVAGILHYFMLSTFLWMLVEAINLYRNFVKIFRSGGDGKFFKNSSLIAWGIPLLVVVINGAVKPDNLGNDQFCVILGNSFYFALLLPVALILLTNFIVLIMVLRSLSKNQGSKITSTQKQSLATQTRITFACATLLGLTWLFALLAVGDLSYTFQLLFTIFNSLQGFFIFVFYTLMNRDVQNEWKRVLNIKDKNSGNSSQPVVSTLNREKHNVKSSPRVGIYGNNDTPSTEEIDLSSSTGHLIRQHRQQYANPTYDQTDNNSFKKL